MSDKVIRELWQVKEELAREFNYDVYALAAEMRRQDRESREKVVDLSSRKPAPGATVSEGNR